MHEIGYAKVNLALHVRAREADGYHRLETIFAFADHGDRLSVAADDGLSLALSGPFADRLDAGDDNLVLCAARALAERFGVSRGAALLLDKRLPVAAGIGGGSADAAAALRLLARFWDLPVSGAALFDIARGLGADVPACLQSRTVRGVGRGDRLTKVEPDLWAGTPILLVHPRVPLPTGAVFGGWDGVDRGPLAEVGVGRNDLTPAALRIAPVICEVLDSLQPARLVRMSGSGATCFALYEDNDARDAAARRIAAARPDWWRFASCLR